MWFPTHGVLVDELQIRIGNRLLMSLLEVFHK
jgi:hypothetical protein